MREYLNEEMVIQFLLKSFNKGKWLFNVQALFNHYQDILFWEDITPIDTPALFLRGGNSFIFLNQSISLRLTANSPIPKLNSLKMQVIGCMLKILHKYWNIYKHF